MIDLLLLHDPPPNASSMPRPTPTQNPWNVSLIPRTEAEQKELYAKLGMSVPKKSKMVPFPPTETDSIRLKIVPVIGKEGDHSKGASANGSGGTKEEGVGSDANDEHGAEGASAKGKRKSGKQRGKERKDDAGGSGIMSSTAAEYGVSYFTWERYEVVRADS